ncbi:TetR family transcriptional regulator [Demequina zhanjiangensis]|uniref:TetR family transcriptional regulator n=1 Tax=Demequina zhanjiangensis TaxID=3051659 RepID=A0ABT8G2Q4_9MICO|nr:TetR family transcriptional regulator [Demequina sp. SYSU T00b26]MDN4473287.1 TetR family transcriptional regulator [Demequina sp. SYSU T00b26]
MTEERPIGAREAARRRVRAALAGAARSLVVENGYDETTIEMIAERAGVSRRTFFRHFETKDAVLLHYYDDLGEQIADAILGMPDDIPSLAAVTESFRVVERFLSEGDERASQSQLAQIVAESPRLHAARNYRRRHNVELAVRALITREHRAGREMSQVAASAIAGAAFSCLYAAEKVFLTDPSTDAVTLFEEGANALADAMGAMQAYQAREAAVA